MPGTITRELAEAILDALDGGGGEVTEGSLRTDYNGRSMYNETCFGFVVEDGNAMLLGMAIFKALREDGGEEGEDVATSLGRAARTDSMGRAIIVYFPGWKIVDKIEDDD